MEVIAKEPFTGEYSNDQVLITSYNLYQFNNQCANSDHKEIFKYYDRSKECNYTENVVILVSADFVLEVIKTY